MSAPAKRFRRGLVVGKFAPLHCGHEFLIRTALAACDEVVLLSYANPEPAGCEAARRRAWLASLFPETLRLVIDDAWLREHAAPPSSRYHGVLPATLLPDTAPADAHRAFCAALCHHVLGVRTDAVFTSEDYGDGFAAVLTAAQQRHAPTAPPVTHVLVDRARTAVPISGTAIRADVYAHRAWLPPPVYASFVQRVAILGGESSGKTSLATALAARFSTSWVPEYGRELWEEKQGHLTPADLLTIARTQLEREDAALLAPGTTRFLFCDTTPLTTLGYAGWMFGPAVAPPAELHTAAQRPYTLTVLCAPDFPFVQDGTRRDATFREAQHTWYVAALARQGVTPLVARGTLAERVASVAQQLHCVVS